MTRTEAIKQLRTRARAQLEQASEDARAQLDALGRLTCPIKGAGEWDWFYGLSRAEQSRLQRRWVGSVTGRGPDTAESPDWFGSIEAWVTLTRIADAARLARVPQHASRLHELDALGGLGLDELVSSDYVLASALGTLELAGAYLDARDAQAEWESVEEYRPHEDTDDAPVVPIDPADDGPDLLGMQEVADLLGASIQTVSSWHARGQMPQPAAVLKAGVIWHARTIHRWIERPTSIAGRRLARRIA